MRIAQAINRYIGASIGWWDVPYLDDESIRAFYAMLPAPRIPTHGDIEIERARIRRQHPAFKTGVIH